MTLGTSLSIPEVNFCFWVFRGKCIPANKWLTPPISPDIRWFSFESERFLLRDPRHFGCKERACVFFNNNATCSKQVCPRQEHWSHWISGLGGAGEVGKFSQWELKKKRVFAGPVKIKVTTWWEDLRLAQNKEEVVKSPHFQGITGVWKTISSGERYIKLPTNTSS